MNRLVESLLRRSGSTVAAVLVICTPALAEPVATGPTLPERVAEHFGDLGVSVDPRQLAVPQGPVMQPMSAEADAPAAGKPLRVGVFERGTSATIATIPIDGKRYATAWQPGPSFAGSRVERLTAVAPEGRSTAVLDDGRLKKIADDRGQFVALGRNGSRRTLTVDFNYGYKRDRRVVELPDGIGETAAPDDIAASAESASTAKAVDKRKVRLKVKACKHWPKAPQLLDAWIDINPKHLPDGRAPVSFPLESRVGTIFGGAIDTAKLAEVRRDPAKVTAAVGSAAESVCTTIGKSKKRDLCTALGGEQAATIACRGILAPFSEALCPAVRDASGWKPIAVDEQPNAFTKPFEVRFNARFLSPYGYAWVSSSKPKKYGPRSEVLEETLELPCWDVYEAPVKMTGSYQWPTCFSPYAEANATVQFANYMKGWYAWAGLSNWKLTVFQTQDCLARNYIEGPFTPAGGAKLDGGYAHWMFSNAKWGGPDNFEAHINFAGDKMWGNVKDSRRSRHTSERATLYGEFSGKRAK